MENVSFSLDLKDIIYNNIEKTFKATRYHSLYLEKENFPKNLEITSQSTDDKVLMSFKHKIYPIYGVQYHPESIETFRGPTILKNFIDIL